MAQSERILDSKGKYLGTVMTESNGDKRLLGVKKLLGMYNKSMNTTYDGTGKVIARSDQLLLCLANQ